MYWSEVAVLSVTPVNAVEATAETLPRATLVNRRVMPSVMPPAVSVAPKHIAHKISHTVLIMPPMPRVATSSVSISFDVAILVEP